MTPSAFPDSLWLGHEDDREEFAEQPFKGSDDETQVERLEVLRSLVKRQVQSRDRQMVEQSSHIVCLLPYGKPDGTKAGGVAEEADFYEDLRRRVPGARSRGLYFNPSPHEARRRRNGLIAVLEEIAQERNTSLRRWSHEAATVLETQLSDEWLLSWTVGDPSSDELVDTIVDILRRELSEEDRPWVWAPDEQAVMRQGTEPAHMTEVYEQLGSRIRARVLGHDRGEYSLTEFAPMEELGPAEDDPARLAENILAVLRARLS